MKDTCQLTEHRNFDVQSNNAVFTVLKFCRMRPQRGIRSQATARQDIAASLAELRGELRELEDQQKLAERQSAESNHRNKATKRNKSVLARRLLEHTRLQALQQRADAAHQRITRVKAFNHAMQEQQEAMQLRIDQQQRMLAGPPPRSVAPLAPLLDVQEPGSMLGRGAKFASFSEMGPRSLLQQQLQTMRDVLAELNVGATPASDSPPTSSTEPALRERPEAATPPPFPLRRESLEDPMTELLAQKAAARLARLESREAARRHREVIVNAGRMSHEECLIDGVALMGDAEANMAAARARRDQAAAHRPVDKNVSERSAVASTEEQRKLAAMAHREAAQRSLAVQRGQLQRLQERLQELETKGASVTDVPDEEIVVEAPTSTVPAPEACQQQHPHQDEKELRTGFFATDDAASGRHAEHSADAAAPVHHPETSPRVVADSAGDVVQRPAPHAAPRLTDDEWVSLRQQCGSDATDRRHSRARGALIAALHSEAMRVEQALHSAIPVLQSVLRSRAAEEERFHRCQISASVCCVQNTWRGVLGARQMAARQRIHANFGVSGAPFANSAATLLQRWWRLVREAHRRRIAVTERHNRNQSIICHESAAAIQTFWQRCVSRRRAALARRGNVAATKIQSAVRRFLAQKRLRAERKRLEMEKEARRRISDDEFRQDQELQAEIARLGL